MFAHSWWIYASVDEPTKGHLCKNHTLNHPSVVFSLEKEALRGCLEPFGGSSAVPDPGRTCSHGHGASATSSHCVGPQRPVGSEGLRDYGTEKADVENTWGLVAEVRVQRAGPLCAITQRTFLFTAHLVMKLVTVKNTSRGLGLNIWTRLTQWHLWTAPA